MDCNVRELEFGIGASHAELPIAGSETSLKERYVHFSMHQCCMLELSVLSLLQNCGTVHLLE